MKISVGKSKLMRCRTTEGQEPLRVKLNGEEFEEMKKVK